MLPPPPLPPMARPVAIIRSTGDLSMLNSPSSSITPPNVNNMSSPQQREHGQGSDGGTNPNGGDINQSPPISPHESHQHSIDCKSLSSTSSQSLTRLASSYSTAPIPGGREYTFNPFHNSSTQVRTKPFIMALIDVVYLCC